MPILQVRDCPQALYDGLRQRAEREHRSIAQQCVVAVEQHLEHEQPMQLASDNTGSSTPSAQAKRGAILDRAASRAQRGQKNALVQSDIPDGLDDFAAIVREIRDNR